MSTALAPVTPELVWFEGPDSVRFLDDLISQDIAGAEVGEVRRSLLLTPQGKVDFILWALRGQDRVGLVTEDGRGSELVARLSRYLIRVEVTIETSPLDAYLVIGAIEGERGRWAGDRSRLMADLSWVNAERTLTVGERPDLPMLDAETYELARIEAGEPLAGVDVTDSTIPQETGLVLSSISFDKGCFLGQELVARLDSREGRVNHNLRVLRFPGSVPPMGAEITRGGAVVGTLTSVTAGAGLALLRRGVEPGDVVEAGGFEAMVEAVPGS